MKIIWTVVGLSCSAFVAQVQPPAFYAHVDLVRLDVLVTDGRRPLVGLETEDFEVRDKRVVQRLEPIDTEPLPLDVFLILDASESVAGKKWQGLLRGARAIMRALSPQDRIALITFGDDVAVPLPLTTDHQAATVALEATLPAGSTAMADALYAAAALRRPEATRGVAIVFTDGRDNVSWLSAADVLSAARRSDLLFYGVGLNAVRPDPAPWPPTWSSIAEESDDQFLNQIAQETGGRVLYANSGLDVEDVLTAVLDEVGKRYVLSYYPRGVEQEGWHEIGVTLRNKRGTVRARHGYLVTESR